MGGISILGTTGIVEPMSEKALVDTIRVELTQRRRNGADFVLLTPGNYGSDFIRQELSIDPALAVQCSNYIQTTLGICRELEFRGALLIGHIGKLVKVAGGMGNTHSKYGDCRMEFWRPTPERRGWTGSALPGCFSVLPATKRCGCSGRGAAGNRRWQALPAKLGSIWPGSGENPWKREPLFIPKNTAFWV